MSAAKSHSFTPTGTWCARDQQRQQRQQGQTPHQCRFSNKASNIEKQGILGQSHYVYFWNTLVFHARIPPEFLYKEDSHETWCDLSLVLSFFRHVFSLSVACTKV